MTSSASTGRSRLPPAEAIDKPQHPYLQLARTRLSLEQVRIMGILNVTPDSFYPSSRMPSREQALAHAREMVAEGADIIDIGGEKAGPGQPVSIEEELERVVPVIEGIRAETSVSISIDTFKPSVARTALAAGAEIINNVGGFRDPAMRVMAAETGAAIVVTHIAGEPRVANPHPEYKNVVSDVRAELLDIAETCEADGINPQKIVIDPGPDFGKTTEQDLDLMASLATFTSLPYPVLLSVSRKKFIGEVIGEPVERRLEATLALIAWGVLNGVKLIRAHDVKAAKRACTMTEAVMNPEQVRAVQ